MECVHDAIHRTICPLPYPLPKLLECSRIGVAPEATKLMKPVAWRSSAYLYWNISWGKLMSEVFRNIWGCLRTTQLKDVSVPEGLMFFRTPGKYSGGAYRTCVPDIQMQTCYHSVTAGLSSLCDSKYSECSYIVYNALIKEFPIVLCP